MMKIYFQLLLFAIFVTLFAGCAGNTGPGSFLGIPAFILDPIYYANTEVNGDQVDLDIRKIYAVVYTDSSGTPNDDSLWIFFVTKNTNLEHIASGDFAPFVVLKIKDIDNVTPGEHYSIKSVLDTTNFMVRMDINDGGDVFIGDTIELDLDRISNASGGIVEGEFTSTLHRGSSIGLAEKFKFEAPVNLLDTEPMEF